MAKLPRAPDPDRLRGAEPALIRIGPGELLHRIYKRAGPHPTLWNSFRHIGPLSRFDHHEIDSRGDPCDQDRGILYAAMDVPTAVAEFFGRNQRRVNRFRHQPWLASFDLADEIRLLDLTDTFCVRVGASMKLMSGPFSHSQAWSRGFHATYADIHGLYYGSSLTNRPTIALYERALSTPCFPDSPRLNRALADPALHRPLTWIASEIGYSLI
jgi:hypothetical protein